MNISIEIDQKNQKVVADIKGEVDKESNELIKLAGKTLYEEARAITGKTYFSKYQLKKLGFPYATKYKKNYLMDDRIVNFQSGTLHNSLRWNVWYGKDSKRTKLWSNCPYVAKLVEGTDKARPRNFMELAYERMIAKLPKLEEKFLKSVK